MSASRYPMALCRDNLLPGSISKVNKRFKTPVRSLIITGVFIILALILPLEMLVKVGYVVILTAYVLTKLYVIILRESKLKNYSPSFKAPFYPWLQIAAIVIFSLFIIDLGLEALEITLAFLAISSAFYFIYGKKKYKGEYALLHFLKRITDNKLKEHILESEFRDILIERESIKLDKFDELVKEAEFIDLESSIDFKELFSMIAHKLTDVLPMNYEEIYSLMLSRQLESNTAISKFVAIPHIIISGKNHFKLFLVRCREGVYFTADEPDVKAIFIFVGTKEDRAFHLKTLASIATLVQQDDFEEKWLNSEDIHYLRDMVLLSKRIRFHLK